MVPSTVSGDLTHSPSTSGIYFQGDEPSQALASSLSNSSFRLNPGSVSGDMNSAALNSVTASSLVTDANSALSSEPHLQRSASINSELYMRLPASPISFTSNNISTSDSSIMDGLSVARPSSHQERTTHSMCQNQLQQPGAASSLPPPASENGQALPPVDTLVRGSYIHDPNSLPRLTKKPRLDIKQEDIIQQQDFQQLLRRQDSMQLRGLTPQSQAILLQQYRMRQQQQQQILQSMLHMQRALVQQQQQQRQLRHQLQLHGFVQMNAVKRPLDGGICARRLMQYLYHRRQRPAVSSCPCSE